MSTTTHTLKHPIELKNQQGEVIETITQVKIHRPKGKDYRAMKSDAKVAMTLELVASCTSLPPSTIDLMDGEDLNPLMEIVGGFFGGVPLTGGTS